MKFTAFIGLDLQKYSIAVAIVEEGRHGEVRFYGSIPNTPGALTKLVGKLVEKYGQIEFVYEAGPCGYAVHRHLTRIGQICRVTAPCQPTADLRLHRERFVDGEENGSETDPAGSPGGSVECH